MITIDNAAPPSWLALIFVCLKEQLIYGDAGVLVLKLRRMPARQTAAGQLLLKHCQRRVLYAGFVGLQ